MRIPEGDQMMMVHGQAARHKDTWRRSDGTRAGSQTQGYLEEIRWYMDRQPDTRIPGGDQMVHGQAAGHKDTWRRSDGTRAGSRTQGYLKEIR